MKVETALISVSDKTGLMEFATFLSERGVALISTGGTARALKEAGLGVRDVADVTGFPEIMDGRVKTLHPKVHGGLLGVRDNPSHRRAMGEHGIEPIDLVVVNLYPFERAVSGGANILECIENIDIGGPAMIRAAAKNHAHVAVVVSPERYASVMNAMKTDNVIPQDLRKELAAEAFAHTAGYDAAISAWFQSRYLRRETPAVVHLTGVLKQPLRYGENPHQKAALYADPSSPAVGTIAHARQMQGKELSYNNFADSDAALALAAEFDEPACAIIKHANPCGVAVGKDVVAAYEKALACDPVSAYGGILAFNHPVTATMAEALGKHFVEVVIAPHFDRAALDILAAKKNLRLLEVGSMPDKSTNRTMFKNISGGFLVQDYDNNVFSETVFNVVTRRAPTEQEQRDLAFAFTVAKHVKSNAIVYALDGKTVGIGAGQMSRVDASRIGAWKAKETCTGVADAKGSVLASDAFFPFADGLEYAAEQGVTAVIQPGGSIRDDEVIAAANYHNMAMVFTGIRHFKH